MEHYRTVLVRCAQSRTTWPLLLGETRRIRICSFDECSWEMKDSKVSRARATRGLRRPSLDARTMENRQAALLMLKGEDDGVFSRQPYMGMDRPTMKP